MRKRYSKQRQPESKQELLYSHLKSRLQNKIRPDQEDHFISIKKILSPCQGEIKIVNISVPNVGTHSFIKQTPLDIKSQVGLPTKQGNFNISFSLIGRSSRQKINKETSELNNKRPNKYTKKCSTP
jgi:hypothetical protein